jgi:hypothetical protein
MRRVPEFQFEWIDRSHPNRASVESFIATVFARRYGAQVRYFSDVIIGSRDEEGRWIAAVGFSALSHHSAYLENYLDQPVEYLIAASVRSGQLFRRVSRWDIVEVGNLAAIRAGAASALILHMTRYLYRRHFQWVVLTATKELSNSFSRLGYQPTVITAADPNRLEGCGKSWGTYYESHPEVVFVDIGASYAHIAAAN